MYILICESIEESILLSYTPVEGRIVVMMLQQGFVVCDIPEVKNLSKLLSFLTLRTAILVNDYASNTFAGCLDP